MSRNSPFNVKILEIENSGQSANTLTGFGEKFFKFQRFSSHTQICTGYYTTFPSPHSLDVSCWGGEGESSIWGLRSEPPTSRYMWSTHSDTLARKWMFVGPDTPLSHASSLIRETSTYTVKKGYRFFPSPAGMSLTKLSLAENNFNYSWPERVWLVRWGNRLPFLQCSSLPSHVL